MIWHKKVLLSFLLYLPSYGVDTFTESACSRTFGISTATLDSQRSEDYQFEYSYPLCCCNDEILTLFSANTKKENEEVNPAVDIMLRSMGEFDKMIRLRVKEVENLKQISALYAFEEFKMVAPATSGAKEMNLTAECVNIELPDDIAIYLATIDKMENGNSYSYTAQNPTSSAYGRYQFVTNTANGYCKRVTDPSDCCSTWKNKPTCQDNMFIAFTLSNVTQLKGYGGIPITNCSLYVAHQQGSGGARWIYTGVIPSKYLNPDGSINNIGVDKIRKNVPTFNTLLAGRDEHNSEVLRDIYITYWSERFNADIMSGVERVKLDDFIDEPKSTDEYFSQQHNLFGDGAIMELNRILTNVKNRRRSF